MNAVGVVSALGVTALGAALTVLCLLQWFGRLGRGGDPRAGTERLYLLTPLALTPLVLGLLLLVESLGGDVPEAVTGTLFLALMLAALASLILWVVRPERLRPAWQRRRRQRDASRARSPSRPGRYAVEVSAMGVAVRRAQHHDDLEEAAAAARRVLEDDAEAEFATIHDTVQQVAVRTVERDG